MTTSQWLLDQRQIRSQLNGILQLPDVHYVEIRPVGEGEAVIALGNPVSGGSITRRYPMVYSQHGRQVPVGQLTVVAALDGVYARMRSQFLMILGTQTVRTFATSLFILFVVQYLFTRHLQTQNLVENSIKFMGEEPEPVVEIGVRGDDRELVCFVRDNGIGIEPGMQQDVFGLFNKLDAATTIVGGRQVAVDGVDTA